MSKHIKSLLASHQVFNPLITTVLCERIFLGDDFIPNIIIVN